METPSNAELTEFAEEARTWLEENVPGEPRPPMGSEHLRAFDEDWQRRQYEGGWAGIAWPEAYGGRGLAPLKQIVWYEQLVRAGGPLDSIFNVAIGHAGPTLILRGTENQRSTYLPPILQGRTPWCQGFSEPDAGSDLASLRCSAVFDGDYLVVTGQKIWTSYAEYADYGEVLVRTDPGAAKHRGITWIIVDMHAAGVDVRPIASIDGYPHNCEVFFDGVRVPVANIVGEVNQGWSVAMSTLAAERGTSFLDHRFGRIELIDEMVDFARDRGLLDNRSFTLRLGELRAEAAALRSMAYYQVASSREGEPPPVEATAVRAFFVDHQVKSTELAMEMLGENGLEWSPWAHEWLSDFGTPIAGGSKDILRNVIGERVLGLPR
jgi:alkylation response protein AidB-like acyl-CoA dehydrogenase